LYASGINPIPGPNEWPIDLDVDPIEPPILKKQCGRPRKLKKKKKKKRDYENVPDESVKVTHKGYDVRCRNCGQKGHNIRSYCQPENSNRKKYPKRVRNSKPTVVRFFYPYGRTIICFTIECYNYVIDLFVYIMW
jgi:hypothetical protein